MPAKWKGSAGPILTNEESSFDAETLQVTKRVNWAGRADAIAGLELDLQENRISYGIHNDGPVYNLSTRVPITNPDTEAIDQYEISTESTTIPIWLYAPVAAEIRRHDGGADAPPSYQEKAEMAAKGETVSFAGVYDLFPHVFGHIQAGHDTFSIDNIVLRRFRRISRAYSAGVTGKMTTDDGSVLYSTAQLQLPADVAFVVPATPSLPTSGFAVNGTPGKGTIHLNLDEDFVWRWRKRGQRVEFIGQWVEQTVELVFAQHSLLKNSLSGSNLVW